MTKKMSIELHPRTPKNIAAADSVSDADQCCNGGSSGRRIRPELRPNPRQGLPGGKYQISGIIRGPCSCRGPCFSRRFRLYKA